MKLTPCLTWKQLNDASKHLHNGVYLMTNLLSIARTYFYHTVCGRSQKVRDSAERPYGQVSVTQTKHVAAYPIVFHQIHIVAC